MEFSFSTSNTNIQYCVKTSSNKYKYYLNPALVQPLYYCEFSYSMHLIQTLFNETNISA